MAKDCPGYEYEVLRRLPLVRPAVNDLRDAMRMDGRRWRSQTQRGFKTKRCVKWLQLRCAALRSHLERTPNAWGFCGGTTCTLQRMKLMVLRHIRLE